MPHESTLEGLRIFFEKSIWSAAESKKWRPWILDIQLHRNAIHALKPRPMGTWADLKDAVKVYAHFLQEIDTRLPQPD